MRSRKLQKLAGPGFILAVGIAAYAVFSGVSVSWPLANAQSSSVAPAAHRHNAVASTKQTEHPQQSKAARDIDAREDYVEQLRGSQSGTGAHSSPAHADRTMPGQVVDPTSHMNWRQFHAWTRKPHGVP